MHHLFSHYDDMNSPKPTDLTHPIVYAQNQRHLASNDTNNNYISSTSTSFSSFNQPDLTPQIQRPQQYSTRSSSINLCDISDELSCESDDQRMSSSRRSNNSADSFDDLGDIEVPLELAREDIEMVVDVYIWFEKVRSFLLGLLC